MRSMHYMHILVQEKIFKEFATAGIVFLVLVLYSILLSTGPITHFNTSCINNF